MAKPSQRRLARSLVVKRALQYLNSLASESHGDRSLQMEIAAAYERVGEIQGDPMFPNMGDSRGALQSSRKSLAIREALLRADPANRELRVALASVHQQISNILDVMGESVAAIEHGGEAERIYEALGENLTDDPHFESALIVQTYQYAKLLWRKGDIDDAAAVSKGGGQK